MELVEETVVLGGRSVVLLRPRDSEALIDEAAFEREEFLPYWAELWPSALALARVVGALPLAGARVVELGCGLALPSLAAAQAGARVLATDWSPDAVVLVRLNAARNRIDVETALCSWAEPGVLLDGAPWDLVLASDVLYERRNADALLGLLPRLGDEAFLADPGRPPAAAFVEAAARDWTVETTRDPLAPWVSLHRLRKL